MIFGHFVAHFRIVVFLIYSVFIIYFIFHPIFKSVMQFSVESMSPIKKSPIIPPLSDSNIDFVVSAGENKKYEEGESPKNTYEQMSRMDSCLYLQYETCYNLAFEV